MFLAIVALCLASFALLCWAMWEDMAMVFRSLRKHHDRISKLETNDYSQDARLDSHRHHLVKVKKDIRELGRDVGWDDSGRSTQVMGATETELLANQTKKPPDDEPPPTAA